MHNILSSLLLAFIIALLWLIFSKRMYNYNKRFPKIFGISFFPLIGWTLGLWVLSQIYFLLSLSLSEIVVVISSIILYWILLILAEYIGYHVFGVHNEAAAKYPGLYPRIPILNCLHAPLWMKVVYFLLGPIMIFVLVILF